MTPLPLPPLTADQRALLHQLIDGAPDDAAARARLAGVPLAEQVLLAGHVQWLHGQIVQAHNARRERIVAQSKKETPKR
jgi:hypothetical protein